jgi:putative ABC transport system permease protein
VIHTTIAGLRARKLRVLTSSIAVLLGVAFMAGSLVLTDTIAKTFDDLFADVSAGTDAYVRGTASIESEMGDDSRARIAAPLVGKVAAVDGVAVAEGVVQGYTQIVGADGKALGNPGQGAPTFGGNWSATDDLNPFDIVDGRAPRAADEVVIDKLSADKGHLAVGDRTTVLVKTGAEPVVVSGIAKFGDLDSPGGASFALFTDATAQRMITAPGSYTGVSVVAEDGVSQAEVRDRIAPILPDDAEVVTGAALTAENQGDIESGLAFFNTFMVTFAAIALFVGAFIIYNTFSIIVAQRSRETALLRALGASRRQVLGSIMFEALVVGVVASMLGIVAGLGMAVLLKALLDGFGFDLPATGLVLLPRTVVTCLLIGVGVSVLSAVVPARRGARIAPVEAMRDAAVEASGTSRWRAVPGTALVAVGGALIALAVFGSAGVAGAGFGAAFTFLGVAVLGPVLTKPATQLLGLPLPSIKGTPGTLARNNAVRNPKRTSATASALMIGVGLVGFIMVLAASAKASIDDNIDRSFGADLVIDAGSTGSFGGLPPSLRDDVAALPEVGTAAAVRTGMAELEGEPAMLVAFGPGMDEMFDLGITDGDLDALGPSDIAVGANRAAEEGWRLGDEVAVTFAQTGVQHLRISVLYHNPDVADDVILGLPAWEANVTDQFDTRVYVLFADGVDTAAARAAIEDVTASLPIAEVQDLSEFKEAQTAEIDQILGLIYALLGLAVLIAVLGIANTLALSILERTRELGLLRAVGMTRPQLRSTVRWESVLIALFGTAMGLVVGVLFSSTMVLALDEQGIGAVVVPARQLATVAVLAAVCGVAAAALPARRAARLDVLGAIATA